MVRNCTALWAAAKQLDCHISSFSSLVSTYAHCLSSCNRAALWQAWFYLPDNLLLGAGTDTFTAPLTDPAEAMASSPWTMSGRSASPHRARVPAQFIPEHPQFTDILLTLTSANWSLTTPPAVHRAATATTTPSMHRSPRPPTLPVSLAAARVPALGATAAPTLPAPPSTPLPAPPPHPLRRSGRSHQAGGPGQEKPPSRWACRRRRHLDAVVGGAGRRSGARRRGAVPSAAGGGRSGAAQAPLAQLGGVRNRECPGLEDPQGHRVQRSPGTGQPQPSRRVSESVVRALLELWQAWVVPLSAMPRAAQLERLFPADIPLRPVNTERSVSRRGHSPAAPSAAPGPFGRADPLWLGKSRGWNNLECLLRSACSGAGTPVMDRRLRAQQWMRRSVGPSAAELPQPQTQDSKQWALPKCQGLGRACGLPDKSQIWAGKSSTSVAVEATSFQCWRLFLSTSGMCDVRL